MKEMTIMKLNETQIAEVYENLDQYVENEFNLTYVPHIGKRSENNAFFDFDTEDECYIHFYKSELLEEEDEILENVKSLFNEMGYEPTLEMDYDTGYEDLEHTLRIYL